VVSSLRTYPGFGEALALLAESDIAQRRRERQARRVRDDDWYCARFQHALVRRNRMAKKKAAKKAGKKAAKRSKKKPAKRGARPNNPPPTGTIGHR
jgi:hypothetical protein